MEHTEYYKVFLKHGRRNQRAHDSLNSMPRGPSVLVALMQRLHYKGHQSTHQAHCFTLLQQQKVTKSKYFKDLGHTVIEQTEVDNIINTTTTQEIYDLTLGLSNKEQRMLVTGKAHKASTINFGKTKKGAT